MKKVIIFLFLILNVFLLSSCKKEEEKVEKINVLLPSGIPALAVGNIFDDEAYDFTVVDGASMLSAELVKGDYDIIIAPVILGAQLYVKGNTNYKLSTILSTGNTYIVSRSENVITDIKDLEGETIASYGQNTAPDILLKASLEMNGVDISKITFVYENSVSDAFTNRFMVSEPVKYVLSAEPIISKMNSKAFKSNPLNVYNLQSQIEGIIPQAGIFIKSDLEKDYNNFLDKVKNNVDLISSSSDLYAGNLMNLKSENSKIFTSLTLDVIKACLPNCGIVFKNANEYKEELDDYFKIINQYNGKILNGQEVNQAFYI